MNLPSFVFGAALALLAFAAAAQPAPAAPVSSAPSAAEAALPPAFAANPAAPVSSAPEAAAPRSTFWDMTDAAATAAAEEDDDISDWLSGAQPGAALLPVANLLAVGYGEARLAAPRGPALGLESGVEVGRGEASWYGPGFHGRLTANGERFNQEAMTAAHKTLPFGTRVRVRVPRTGREVVVRINDRGPYVKGRIIDLSSAAATAIGLKARGHEAVVLHKLSGGGEELPPPAPPGNVDFGLDAGRGAPGLRAGDFK